jgi:hypothetical protein
MGKADGLLPAILVFFKRSRVYLLWQKDIIRGEQASFKSRKYLKVPGSSMEKHVQR